MRKFLLAVAYYFLCLLSFPAPAFSTLVAHIDIVDFPSTIERRHVTLIDKPQQHLYDQQNGAQKISFTRYLRIAFFDQQAQEFMKRSVHYLPLPSQLPLQPPSISKKFPGRFTITCSCQPHFSGTIDLSLFTPDTSPDTSTPRRSKVIRCSAPNLKILPQPEPTPLDLAKVGCLDETRPGLTRVWYTPGQENLFPQRLDLQSVNKFLNHFSNKEKDRNVSLMGHFYFCESHGHNGPTIPKTFKLNFQQKGEMQTLKKEKGRIGELAADITMQCFGFSKRDGKYGGERDNGFDGVYCRDDALFISDSKFFATAPNLLMVLNKDIYATTETRLANMDFQGSPQVKQTAEYIRNFMINKPDRVYLLPYVVLPDGKVKTLAKPFREVHAALDPTRRTEMLEMLFGPLTIVPQNTAGLQVVQNAQPTHSQQDLQITGPDAHYLIQYLMQRLRMHAEYRLVRHEDTWQPITPDSLRNPRIKLVNEDFSYFERLLTQLRTDDHKSEAKRVMGEIAESSHQIQVLRILQIILGTENEKVKGLNLEQYLSWLIRNLSTSLKPNNYAQAEKLAKRVFNVAYRPAECPFSFDLTLESHMVIFETFLASPYLYEEASWERYHALYYLIHGSLCCLEIDPEDTISYLSDFVESLKAYPPHELIEMIRLVHKLYDRKCFSDLKGVHDCEDWILLMQAFQPLASHHRSMIVDFLKEFPSGFNYGPADAVDFFKHHIPLMNELRERVLFDSTDTLINQAFNIYDDPSDQATCLEIIMQGVKDDKSEKEIMETISKRLS